jgi:hypothetical protein
MNRKIRLELADRTIITATVTSAFEAATDAEGRKWRWHGVGARGHLWLLISSTRTPSGAIGHPRSSPIYAVEL